MDLGSWWRLYSLPLECTKFLVVQSYEFLDKCLYTFLPILTVLFLALVIFYVIKSLLGLLRKTVWLKFNAIYEIFDREIIDCVEIGFDCFQVLLILISLFFKRCFTILKFVLNLLFVFIVHFLRIDTYKVMPLPDAFELVIFLCFEGWYLKANALIVCVENFFVLSVHCFLRFF